MPFWNVSDSLQLLWKSFYESPDRIYGIEYYGKKPLLCISLYFCISFYVEFVIVARDEAGKMLLSQFQNGPMLKNLNCGGKPNTLAWQADHKPKTSVNVKWEIPAELAKGKKIVFYAAVAKGQKEIYMLNQSIVL